jgi:hypothetical protein
MAAPAGKDSTTARAWVSVKRSRAEIEAVAFIFAALVLITEAHADVVIRPRFLDEVVLDAR